MSAVGDVVQVLPLVTALKRAFPSTHLSWVIQPNPHSLVAGHPLVDRFFVFRRGSRRKTPRSLWAAQANLRATTRRLREFAQTQPDGCFDLVLNLQVYLKAGLLTAGTPGRLKLGFDWRRTRDLNALFTTHRIPPHPYGHAHTQDQFFEFLRFLGVDPEPITYGLAPTPTEEAVQRSFFEGLHRPACSVVLATSDPRKDWPADRYAKVLDGLYFDFGLLPVLVGGVSRRETRMAKVVIALTRAPVVTAMKDDLRQLLWLLDGSRLVLSPDTGPLHLARALDVPVVGLYGSTNPKRSGPYRKFQDLTVDGYARYPGEDYPIGRKRRRRGMARITPAMVLEKIELGLNRY